MIITVICCVVFVAAVIGGIFMIYAGNKKFGALAIALGTMTLLVGASITSIPTGYVGIRTVFGQISDKPAKPGMNFHIPFIESVHKLNCKQQKKSFDELRVWGETQERTEVYFENIAIDFQINPDQSAWIWQNVEEWDTNLLKQTSVESGIKTAAKEFSDVDVTDRSKIETAVRECVQKNLDEKYGRQILTIVRVTIGNINFTDAYNAEIEKKAKAKLEAETAEYSAKKQKVEAETEAAEKRIKAQAEADEIRIRAEAKADKIRIEAEAEAEANRVLTESLTPRVIENKKIDKWDGKLPSVTGEQLDIMIGLNEEKVDE